MHPGSVYQLVFAHDAHNIASIVPVIPVRVTYRAKINNCRYVRPRNLVKVNISTDGCYGDKIRNINQHHLSVLNARSVNIKQIDILAFTETW